MNDTKTQQLRSLGWLMHGAGAVPAAVIITAFWFGYSVPLKTAKQDVRNQIQGITKQLAEGRGIRAKHRLLKEQLAANQNKIDLVRQRIPDQSEEAEFLRQVTDASVRSGVNIGTYSRGKETAKTQFSQLEIHIQARGTFASICRFLDQLEQIPRVTKVTSLQLDGVAADDGYPLSMTVRLYYGVHLTTPMDKGATHG